MAQVQFAFAEEKSVGRAPGLLQIEPVQGFGQRPSDLRISAFFCRSGIGDHPGASSMGAHNFVIAYREFFMIGSA
ncbi:MAG: hypothetical protein QME74_05675 [Candidatus Edwardsbacteria bacterium]|nr:hypothetical protein [Candidatus Edwardsbacteria bacterium]